MSCTLHCLVAKIAASKVREDLTPLLAPQQLGSGIKGGAEAAVHATQMYAGDLDDNHWIVKLDFNNAFNSLRRGKMLLAMRELAPALYPFVHSSSPSSLFSQSPFFLPLDVELYVRRELVQMCVE